MAWGLPIDEPGGARLERGLLAGVAGFRWAAWAWLVTVVVVTRNDLGRPVVAWALVAVAFGFSVGMTLLVRRGSPWLLRAPTAVLELLIGFTLLAADGWVYQRAHAQTFGSAWPLAGAMSLGIVIGPVGGVAAGVVLGLGRLIGVRTDDLADPSAFSLLSTGVLYALAGGVAGFVMRRLREAELQISAARAREEVARTLHDGVLQTLAVVQRRSRDADLANLAREQELDLRQYLFGPTTSSGDLVAMLRETAARFERHHGVRAEVVVGDQVPKLAGRTVEGVAKAVGEAFTNAAKHGRAGRATVYVEVQDHEVFCSVKDDGRGFDAAAVGEGVGIGRSIRGRIEELGGRVEVDGRPGRGTEVRLWVPI